jgi:hypothetical protein
LVNLIKIAYFALFSVSELAFASNDSGLGEIFFLGFNVFGLIVLIIICWGFYKSKGRLQYITTVLCVLLLIFVTLYLKLYFAHE